MPQAPNWILRKALQAPTALCYAAPWLFGHRLLVLTHRGRRSGRAYRTILEVLHWDPEGREATVMSGFGTKANWVLNVEAGGAEEVRIARLRFRPEAERLGVEEAVQVVADYERDSRFGALLIRTILPRLAGQRHEDSKQARRRLVDAMPVLRLRPCVEDPRD